MTRQIFKEMAQYQLSIQPAQTISMNLLILIFLTENRKLITALKG